MKDIGIRQLKTHASDLVRQVSENHATYTITRRGRAVGVLAPPDFVAPSVGVAKEQAWERLTMLADKLERSAKSRKSAVRELERTRR
jgi:prevent-host-death family protein